MDIQTDLRAYIGGYRNSSVFKSKLKITPLLGSPEDLRHGPDELSHLPLPANRRLLNHTTSVAEPDPTLKQI